MSRITGSEARSLVEAYASIYSSHENITEEMIREDFNESINLILEDGFDLSDYTWEEIYDAYSETLNEAIPALLAAPAAAAAITGLVGGAAKLYQGFQRRNSSSKSEPVDYGQGGGSTFASTREQRSKAAAERLRQKREAEKKVETPAPSTRSTSPRPSVTATRPAGSSQTTPGPSQKPPATPPAPKPPETPPTPPAPPKPPKTPSLGLRKGAGALVRAATSPQAKGATTAVTSNPITRGVVKYGSLGLGGATAAADVSGIKAGKPSILQGVGGLAVGGVGNAVKQTGRALSTIPTAGTQSTGQTMQQWGSGIKKSGSDIQSDNEKKKRNSSSSSSSSSSSPSSSSEPTWGTPKEEIDIFDLVKDHLLGEGYASTEEQANAIMANMSQSWITSILEENN
jgi:hypothetical protein